MSTDVLDRVRNILYILAKHYQDKATVYQVLASNVEKLKEDKLNEILEEASEILDSELNVLKMRKPEKVTFT